MTFDLRSVPTKQIHPVITGVHLGWTLPEPPPPNLKALHNTVTESARTTFTIYGEVPAAFWFFVGIGRWCMVRTEWKDDHEKDVMTDTLRSLVRNMDIRWYSLVHEVYSAMSRPGETPQNAVLPSKRPASERDEMLMILTFERDAPKRQMITKFLISQRPKPQFPILGPRMDEPEDGFRINGGRMALYEDA